MQSHLCALFERNYGREVWQDTAAAENAKMLTPAALVVHDKNDREVPWQQGEMIANNWRGARLMLTSSLGHRRVMRDSQEVAVVVEHMAGPKCLDASLP